MVLPPIPAYSDPCAFSAGTPEGHVLEVFVEDGVMHSIIGFREMEMWDQNARIYMGVAPHRGRLSLRSAHEGETETHALRFEFTGIIDVLEMVRENNAIAEVELYYEAGGFRAESRRYRVGAADFVESDGSRGGFNVISIATESGLARFILDPANPETLKVTFYEAEGYDILNDSYELASLRAVPAHHADEISDIGSQYADGRCE